MYAAEFIDYLRYERRLSNHTVVAYEADLLQFIAFLSTGFEEVRVESATAPMIRSWVVELVNQGLNPSSTNRKIASLRAFYKFLRKRGVIERDPTSMLSALKTKKSPPDFVEEKSIEHLFSNVEFPEGFSGMRDRLVLELLYGTGMRLAELVGLKVNSVDLYGSSVRVLGKRNKERIVPISPILRGLISDYLRERASVAEAGANLMVTDSGQNLYPVFVQRLVRRYLSQATTLSKKNPHLLRHTYATHLLNRGADLNAIKELLGHANLSATQIYTHNSIEKLKKSHKLAHPKA